MGTFERATQRSVDSEIWALISKLREGGWHSCGGGGLPQSAEQAFGICHRAKLIDAEAGPDGTERYRLTVVGEALKDDREGIVAAVREACVAGSQSVDSKADGATYRKAELVGEQGADPSTITKYTKAAGVAVAREYGSLLGMQWRPSRGTVGESIPLNNLRGCDQKSSVCNAVAIS